MMCLRNYFFQEQEKNTVRAPTENILIFTATAVTVFFFCTCICTRLSAYHALTRLMCVCVYVQSGLTPLHVAAHYDNQKVALLLLNQGASPLAAAKVSVCC